MSSSATCVRWRFLTWPAVVLGMSATLAWSAPPEEANPDEAASENVSTPSDLPADAIDLTDKVEVTVNGALRSSGRKAHSVSFTIKNISEEDLQGPIIVLVDETGIEALKLIETTGKLSDGRPYVEIMNDRVELKAGRSIRSEKLNFATDEAVTAQVRDQFELKIRVCRLDPTAVAQDDTDENIPGKNYSWKQFDRVVSIQEKWTMPLFRQGQGQVYGTGVAENEEGELVVRVYTQRSGTDEILPTTVDGVPVQVQTIGAMFEATHPSNSIIYENGRAKQGQGGKVQGPPRVDASTAPDGTVSPQFSGPGGDPTIRFDRPVPIGVSISNANRIFDEEGPLCYAGTLGCRCVDSLGNLYVLTNCHVGGAFEFEPEGDPIPIGFVTGGIGEPIVQPGTLDDGFFFCLDSTDLDDPIVLQQFFDLVDNNQIGTLSDIETIITTEFAQFDTYGEEFLISPNVMDASVVAVDATTTSFDTPIGGYDAIQRTPLERPLPGIPVKKYGRTTIYTEGVIGAVNVTTLVGYGLADTGLFIHQIELYNPRGFQPLGAPGDSGSLLVTDLPGDKRDRQPVGLLFAGGGGSTLANPIGPVLARFGLVIDDGTGDPAQAGVSGTMGGAIGPVIPITLP
ncbi:MAG: hypothetical protein JNG89_00110 [Planctomycetaceae bacterium]|nr:hypothetical protein [Planctomycetaceae bacterium]